MGNYNSQQVPGYSGQKSLPESLGDSRLGDDFGMEQGFQVEKRARQEKKNHAQCCSVPCAAEPREKKDNGSGGGLQRKQAQASVLSKASPRSDEAISGNECL